MRLSRRQLRRIMLEAVRGPDRSDSFILDPELPDDETHPVLSRRSQASYDAHVDPDDIKKLADLYGLSDEEFAVQSDELTDTLLGDEPGTREYSRSSWAYSKRHSHPDIMQSVIIGLNPHAGGGQKTLNVSIPGHMVHDVIEAHKAIEDASKNNRSRSLINSLAVNYNSLVNDLLAAGYTVFDHIDDEVESMTGLSFTAKNVGGGFPRPDMWISQYDTSHDKEFEAAMHAYGGFI